MIALMIESHLTEGRQNTISGQALARGVSVTDACIGFEQMALEKISAVFWGCEAPWARGLRCGGS